MIFDVDGYKALKSALARMCSEFSAENMPDGALFDCKLVASELLSNAVRYGGGARFMFERDGDTVRIGVKSRNDYRPPEVSVCSSVEDESGRGLFLVDAVSETRLYSEEDGVCVIVRIRS